MGMWARMTTFQGPAGQSEEDVAKNTQIMKEQVLPSARKLPGFEGVLSLVDRDAGKGITITLWESEEALRQSEEAANTIRSQAAELSDGNVASVERFEVTVDEPVS